MDKIEVYTEMTSAYSSLLDAKYSLKCYINNLKHSLEDRWDMFILAEKEFKNHKNWITEFNGLPHNYLLIMHSPNRHSHFNTQDLVSEIQEYKLILLEDRHDFNVQEQALINLCDVDKLKESILSQNIVSFEYDW